MRKALPFLILAATLAAAVFGSLQNAFTFRNVTLVAWNSGAAPEPPPAGTLDDTGLVVRYYLDDAASGTTPTEIVDAGPLGYHLTTVDYGSANMAFAEVSGNRGLESSNFLGTQRASRAIAVSPTPDAFYSALHASTEATMELVVRVDTTTANSSRIFAVTDRTGGGGQFALRGHAGSYFLTINGIGSNFFADLSERTVVHLVFDSTQAGSFDRIKVYINGSPGTMTSVQPALNETIFIGTDTNDLILLNRENSGTWDRSTDGLLQYAALYNIAMDAATVSDHYDILSVDDDTP